MSYFAIGVLCISVPMTIFFLAHMIVGMVKDMKAGGTTSGDMIFGGALLALVGVGVDAWMLNIIFG